MQCPSFLHGSTVATTMTQHNEYVQKLIAARDREVAHRRDIAEVLAEKHSRGDMKTWVRPSSKSRT